MTAACPPGYYCPLGTVSKEEFACPNKTYNPEYQKTNASDCLDCPQGEYIQRIMKIYKHACLFNEGNAFVMLGRNKN